jgi:predicted ATPase
VGRLEEIASLESSLRRGTRVVTLTGAGGVGKTRLALAVGAALRHEFPDGVWWVELAAVDRDTDVAAVVAASVGVRPEGGPVTDALELALEGRRLLLIVDNCEHIVDAAASVVERLVRSCPTLAVLATSRERLGVEGEHVMAVRPLGYATRDAPAVVLLVERIDDDAVVADAADQAALVEICARLDGIPLAIELAAARCRALGPADVAARLTHRLLVDHRRRQGRHQTLRATVEWSYDLLSERERRLFDRLSVFAGGFSLEAAEAVCGGDDLDAYELDDLVASLVDKSLVEREGRRYRLLEPIRHFAAEQLERNHAGPDLQAAHARCFMLFVRHARSGLQGPDEATWDTRLRADWGNVRAAFRSACDRGDVDSVSSMVIDLTFQAGVRQSEALLWTEEAYQRFGTAEHPDRHQLVGAAAFAAWVLGDAACVSRAERSAALAAGVETAPYYWPEWAQCTAAVFAGETDRVVDLCAATATRARAVGDQWSEAFWWANVAMNLMFAGRPQDAVVTARQAELVARACGNPSATAQALFGLGAALAATDTTQSLKCLELAHDIGVVVGNRFVRNEASRVLGAARARVMESDAALATLVAVADDHLRDGYLFQFGQTLAAVPAALLRIGRVDDAAIVLGAARASPPAANRTFKGSLDRAEAAIIAQIGAEQFADFAERGRSITPAAIVDVIRDGASAGKSDTGLPGSDSGRDPPRSRTDE